MTIPEWGLIVAGLVLLAMCIGMIVTAVWTVAAMRASLSQLTGVVIRCVKDIERLIKLHETTHNGLNEVEKTVAVHDERLVNLEHSRSP